MNSNQLIVHKTLSRSLAPSGLIVTRTATTMKVQVKMAPRGMLSKGTIATRKLSSSLITKRVSPW